MGGFNEEIDFIGDVGTTEGFIGQLMNTTGLPIGTTFSVEKVSILIFNEDLDNFGNITAIILNNVTDGGNLADQVIVATAQTINIEDYVSEIGESVITFNFTSPVDITIDGTDFIGFKVENVVNTLSFDVFSRVDMNQTSGTCFVADDISSTTWQSCADFGLSGQELAMEILITDTSDELFETTGGIEPDKLVVHFTFDEEQIKDITGIDATSGFTGVNSTISNAGTLGTDADGTFYFYRAIPELVQNLIQLNKTDGLLGDSLIRGTDTNKIIVGNTANRANFAFLHDNSTDIWSINFWIKQKAGDFFEDMGIDESRVFLSTIDGTFQNGITLYTEQENLAIALTSAIEGSGNNNRILVGHTSTSTFPADTNWHMATVIMEKSNDTSTALVCIDNSCSSVDADQALVSTNEVQPTPLFINDDNPSILQEIDNILALGNADYEMDELCIWEDYKLTASDRSTLYNSGTGATCGTVNSSSPQPDFDGDGIADPFEAGFGGIPAEESILIVNSDTGNTATATGSSAAGSTISSGELTVEFPPGTIVDLNVDQKILIEFESGTEPKVSIKAADTSSQTKTVEMPIGIGNNICIVDQTTATIESLDSPSCSGVNTTEVPIPSIIGGVEIASGTAEPSIPTTYTVTRISSTHTIVEGIVHSALGSFRDSDGDTVRDVDDICPNTPQGAEVILSGSGLGCTPTQALQNVIDELQDLFDSNPDTPLADKVEDALASAQTVLDELNKTPPDNQAAAGNIEGVIASLEDAIKDNGFDQTQGELLIDQLLTVSRQLVTNAISIATNTPGSDAGKISSANTALANGDSLRTPPTSFGDFKNAAAEYKVAIAEAEGAIP